MEAERPICAKCGKPVERMRRQVDPSSGDVIFDVFCHGETDRTIIYRDELEDGPIKLFAGVAFTQGGLAPRGSKVDMLV